MNARIVKPTADTIAQAARLLTDGALVAFPTETVYGLGADARNVEAVRRIFAAKNRPADHPVIVHIAGVERVEHWARAFPSDARALAAAFWPGPLTLVLPRAGDVPDAITGGQDSIGLRVPSHPVARELLGAFARGGGSGIAAPSANRYGRISATNAGHVADDLGDDVALILDGGPSAVGIESTIVAFTDATAVILRPGAIDIATLTRTLGYAPRAADAHAPRAPGTPLLHYAPRTAATIVAADALLAEIAQRTGRDEEVAVLARTLHPPDDFGDPWIQAPADVSGYAHELYANLRALDAADADHILIEAVPRDDAWLAVRDRLTRATCGEDDDAD